MRAGWVVRRVGAVVGAVALVVSVSCTGAGDDEQVLVVAPSAVADAAEQVTSGRIEQSVGFYGATMRYTGRFSGDDMAASYVQEGEPDLPEEWAEDEVAGKVGAGLAVPREFLLVDGVEYTSNPERPGRWLRIADISEEPATDADWERDPIGWLLDILAKQTVRRPGRAIGVGGVALTRYEFTLAGEEAIRLLEPDFDREEELSMGADAGTDDPEEAERRWALIVDYRIEHTRTDIVVDLDATGALHSVELTYRADLDQYPDCSFLGFGAFGNLHLELTHLGEPQDIQAPPAELVDEEPLSVLEDGVVSEAELDDVVEDTDPSGQDVPIDEGDPAEAPPGVTEMSVLQTAAGPREYWEVIDSLRQWADERGIDWTQMELPADDQLVALYDQFFAEELQARGPALATDDGLWSRGDVVDALGVLGEEIDVDPAAVASMTDEELVSAFNRLIAEGFAPLIDAGPDAVEDVEGWSSSDDLYAGCPE